MAWEKQRLIDGFVGQLAAGVTSIDTTISSAAFVNLPTDYDQSIHLPLILADDSKGIYEIVYVWGHVANSTSVTISRGQRGTTPQAWPQGTVVRCAPTIYDSKSYMPSATANQLTDAPVGMQVIGEAGGLLTKSRQGNFYGNVQMFGQWSGPAVEGNALPGIGDSPLIQTGHAVGLTLNGGYLNWTLPAGPFPNGVTCALATLYIIATDARVAACKINQTFNNGTQLSVAFYNVNNALVGSGIAANASVLLIGW